MNSRIILRARLSRELRRQGSSTWVKPVLWITDCWDIDRGSLQWFLFDIDWWIVYRFGCCIDRAKITYLQASNLLLAQDPVCCIMLYFFCILSLCPAGLQCPPRPGSEKMLWSFATGCAQYIPRFGHCVIVRPKGGEGLGRERERDKNAHICFGFWNASCYVRLKFQVCHEDSWNNLFKVEGGHETLWNQTGVVDCWSPQQSPTRY